MSANKRSYFNGYAMVFGLFYYIEEGLWKKGLIIGSVSMVIGMMIRGLLPTHSFTVSWLSFILNVGIFGVMGAIDKERKEQFDETMWKELPSFFNKSWVVMSVFLLTIGITIFLGLKFI